MKQFVKKIPFIGRYATKIYHKIKPSGFKNSSNYWEKRYIFGGNSGIGSYEKFADFKAEIINDFVTNNNINSAIEFGCGDGNQLLLANYPKYLGIDVSEQAILMCNKKFKNDRSKTFLIARNYQGETAQLSLSLDVIYHLVEDVVFNNYMNQLFNASNSYVIIYSSNTEENISGTTPHVRHRKFSNWIEKNKQDWQLIKKIANKYPYKKDSTEGSFADFYFYMKVI